MAEQIIRARTPISSKSYKIEWTLVILSTILFAMLLFETPYFFASGAIGVFGLYVFLFALLGIASGLCMRFAPRLRISSRYIWLSIVMALTFFVAIQLAFTSTQAKYDMTEYISYCFTNKTPGGVIFGSVAYALNSVFFEGSYVVLGSVFIVCSAYFATFIISSVGENRVISAGQIKINDERNLGVASQDHKSKTRELHEIVDKKYQELLEKQSRRRFGTAKSELGLTAPTPKPISTSHYDAPVRLDNLESAELPITEQVNKWSTEAATQLIEGIEKIEMPEHSQSAIANEDSVTAHKPLYTFSPHENFATVQPPSFSQPQYPQPNPFPPNSFSAPAMLSRPMPENVQPFTYDVSEPAMPNNIGGLSLNAQPRARQSVRGELRSDVRGEQLGMPISNESGAKPYKPRKYIKPTLDLIRTESSSLIAFRDEAIENQRLLDIKLKEFGVNARVTGFTVAPAVTRFEVQLGAVTRVSQVEQLSKDIAYVLGSPNVRIETTIEGKSAIGIEVPNKTVGKVSIKDIISTRDFREHKSPLAVAIGKNLNDEAVIDDICTMPHLLIAGSTGSGKSVCLNTLLTSLLFRAHPDEVKLLLVDMKRVELNMYNNIPHMLIPTAIKEVEQVINALHWLEDEMKRRYSILESNGINNISLYHAMPNYVNGTLARMPYIIMVIDEAADLIAKGKRDVEDSIKSLSSLARACGIHIILATQRPSVNVITSVIKTNFTVRIAFKVSSRFDSVTIINNGGAEKLVGRGDMLFLKEGHETRVQGAFIELEETRRVMNFIRDNNEFIYDPDIEDIIINGPPPETASSGFGDADGVRNRGAEQDAYFVPVLKWLVREDNIARVASISSMQRQFGVGFNRAGKIMDQLTAAGYVSQPNGTKTRDVLVTREFVESMYGE